MRRLLSVSWSFVVTVVTAALLVGLVGVVAPPAATAHEERESQFPPGTGSVPTYRSMKKAADVIVVCKPSSKKRILRIKDRQLRKKNLRLLKRCEHRHIQAAVDAVRVQRTNIYVLPGVYTERPSHYDPCMDSYDGGIVEYRQVVSCGEIINLVTVAGDDPADPDHACDNQLCRLQIEGTGARPTQVVLRGGFKPNGDWVKHNGIKADRADGFYIANMTAELFRENAFYVHETDGYVMDRIVGRRNDLYGVLTFASDHGLIQNCEAYHNGDSGIYPGSAADVNKDNRETGPLTRWSVEVRHCDMHHNALGYSGTAGNSVYVHHNKLHHNGLGFVVESILGGHPGMPQDHAWFTQNDIYSNNVNYYGNVQPGGPCQREKPRDRGHQFGVVCPPFGFPVGTGGMMIGNHNYVHGNRIWDNWRSGIMSYWVPPAALRGDYNPLNQLDNNNHNEYSANTMGVAPDGSYAPNGLDFWWDDAGTGNCWQDNVPYAGKQITHNATLGSLPDCSVGSVLPANPVKTVQLLPCAEYDRYSNPSPAGCDWIESPPRPTARTIAAAMAVPEPDSPRGPVLLVGGVLVSVLAVRLAVRRRAGAAA